VWLVSFSLAHRRVRSADRARARGQQRADAGADVDVAEVHRHMVTMGHHHRGIVCVLHQNLLVAAKALCEQQRGSFTGQGCAAGGIAAPDAFPKVGRSAGASHGPWVRTQGPKPPVAPVS